MNATTIPCPQERTAFGQVPAPVRLEAPRTDSAGPVTVEPTPWLDLQNLTDIVEDTGTPALAVDFLDDYILLLNVRMSRIMAALELEDAEASINAALSLKTASQMAGALDIAEQCSALLSAIASRKFQHAHDLASTLKGSVERMADASPLLLETARTHLSGPAGASPGKQVELSVATPAPSSRQG